MTDLDPERLVAAANAMSQLDYGVDDDGGGYRDLAEVAVRAYGVIELMNEVAQLNEEVMAHQTTSDYDRGYFHATEAMSIRLRELEAEIARHHADFERWEEMADKGAQQIAEVERLSDYLHARHAHPDYEYLMTTCPRKGPYDTPEGGWEENEVSRSGYYDWKRFEYHEEMWWRRKKD